LEKRNHSKHSEFITDTKKQVHYIYFKLFCNKDIASYCFSCISWSPWQRCF